MVKAFRNIRRIRLQPTPRLTLSDNSVPLNGARSLYAAVLFQVDGAAVADDVFREAERYDLGFAHMVHGAQSEEGGDAIRLAWDDEQVAEWLNRQVDPMAEAPMGTAGYRVDVRRQGDAQWNSLVRIASAATLRLGPHELDPFEGEAVVEVVPAHRGEFWMPPYFTTWRGSSLALTDQNLVRLHENPELANPDAEPYLLNRERSFLPVDDKLVPLLYGHTYEFRVRLADLTRGGPPAGDDIPPISGAITTIPFQRRTQPGQINVRHRPAGMEPFITLDASDRRFGLPACSIRRRHSSARQRAAKTQSASGPRSQRL